MKSTLPGSRRRLMFGVLATGCLGAIVWWQYPSGSRTVSNPTSGTPLRSGIRQTTVPGSLAGSPTSEAALAAHAAPERPVSSRKVPIGPGLPKGPSAPREMDIALNPYAAALHAPGTSKRGWDAAYIDTFHDAKSGDPVRFELTDGLMAEGKLTILKSEDGEVTYVSGELTAPEKGDFFILAPPIGGRAGTAVAVVRLMESQTAYRVEPTGVDGSPELWKRQMDEVVCTGMEEVDPDRLKQSGEAEAAAPLRPGAGPDYTPAYNGAIPALQSYPGSPAVLFLDFAGGYSGSWNGGTFVSAGNSPADIKSMWQRVAEDYMPFNINVTTDPKVFDAAAFGSRMRCCVGPDTVTTTGVAYIGSWNWGGEIVCWANYSTGKVGSETCAHEPGHTLGLGHQGQVFADGSVNGYYAGQGSGETGWAPIMGASYYDNVGSWAKGEYQYANNPQDELATIVTNNNVHYRTDDTGNTLATSRYLDVDASNNVTAEGVIETSGDADSFQFTTTGGAVSLTASPVSNGPNLGIKATIENSAGTILATDNVQSKLSASISTTLAAGTYTFTVTGVGKNNPLTDGFSNYGSLGYYSISGSVAGARQPTRLTVADHAAVNTVVGTVPANNPNSSPLTYSIASGNTGGTFTIDNGGVVKVANNSAIDYFALVANPALYSPQFELFVNITNNNNSAYNETNRRVLVTVQKVLPGVPLYLTATAGTDLRTNLSWQGDPDATSYNIKRSTTPGGPYTTIASSTQTIYTDGGLTHGVTYYYVVSALNGSGQTANSAEASVVPQALAGFSFEGGRIGNGFIYNPGDTVWTFSGTSPSGSGIVGNGSAFGNVNAPDGNQAAFVQGTGTISQTLSGFVPGTTYQVRYLAAQRAGWSETWDVKIDGTVIQSNAAGSTNYAPYLATFTASSTTHTLTFAGTDIAANSDTVFIDQVQVSEVTPVIGNADFEAPVVSGFQYNPSGGSWTFNGASPNGSGIVRNGGAFGNAACPVGVQAGMIQATGVISQTLSGFIVGRTYTLSYAAAQRAGWSETWDVKIDGTVIQSNPAGSTAFTPYTVNFTATSTTHTLSFVGTDIAANSDAVFIDNVTLMLPLHPVAPTVTLTAPANNATGNSTTAMTLSASVTANGNLINSVQFYADGGTLIGTATTSPYNYSWTNPTPGAHAITAKLLFNNGSSILTGAANIIVTNTNQDLGFESPALGAGAFQYNPTGGSWTFNGASPDGSGIVRNGSAFGNVNAVQGSQAAFVQSHGIVSQYLGGFVPGSTYQIQYSAAQRAGWSQTWDVKIDNTVLQSNTPGSTSYATYTTSFTATAAIHKLSFVGTDLAGNADTVFIDNVSVTMLPPAAPTGLAATQESTQTKLTWTASASATSYNVKRATTSGGPYTTIASPTVTNYLNTGLTNGTTYYYVVSAVNAGGEGTNSGQATVLPQMPAVANASFESPALTAGQYQYNTTGGTWAFAAHSGLVSNGSGFSNPAAPLGTQAAFVQDTGSMSQSVSGLTIGTTYTVTFAAAQRPGANQHGGESWNVKLDSLVVGSYNPGPAATTYVDYTATFTATAGTHTLAFVGTDLVGGDNTVFIDNVRLAVATNPIPSPWARQDIAVTGSASSASYAGGLFTFTGAGLNVDSTSDSCSFISQASSGDCSITARVASLQNTGADGKGGVAIRESLNANSARMGIWVSSSNGIILTTRTSTGAASSTVLSAGKVAPYWVRITRTGNSFAAYYSANGTTWSQLGSTTTITMSSSAYIGLGVNSGFTDRVNTATFDNITAVP